MLLGASKSFWSFLQTHSDPQAVPTPTAALQEPTRSFHPAMEGAQGIPTFPSRPRVSVEAAALAGGEEGSDLPLRRAPQLRSSLFLASQMIFRGEDSEAVEDQLCPQPGHGLLPPHRRGQSSPPGGWLRMSLVPRTQRLPLLPSRLPPAQMAPWPGMQMTRIMRSGYIQAALHQTTWPDTDPWLVLPDVG